MTDALFATFLGIAVTAIGALLTGTWWMATTIAKLQAATKSTQDGLAKVERCLDLLQRIPLVEQRVDQLEEFYENHVSRYHRK